ncbi:hypothetical protein [Phaffia rhodozyma]|uniref:Uncharacterized protein n=1 Tax=Phaffia rhodozyma TaxID=264483 RepID=A0A0F7SU81_PHARH|nr:hypothetical protein [Phaffia rhodozyma]
MLGSTERASVRSSMSDERIDERTYTKQTDKARARGAKWDDRESSGERRTDKERSEAQRRMHASTQASTQSRTTSSPRPQFSLGTQKPAADKILFCLLFAFHGSPSAMRTTPQVQIEADFDLMACLSDDYSIRSKARSIGEVYQRHRGFNLAEL